MKILVDATKKNKKATKHTIRCEYCNSELEFDTSDVYVDDKCCQYIECPCCGGENILDDAIELSFDNLVFPQHFFHFSEQNECAHVSDKEIQEWIMRCKSELDSDNDAYTTFICCGDSMVSMMKDKENKEYLIQVTRDYYEVHIPFEDSD